MLFYSFSMISGLSYAMRYAVFNACSTTACRLVNRRDTETENYRGEGKTQNKYLHRANDYWQDS